MEFNDKKAIYLQIAERLMDEILRGDYAEEDRIPSVREYAGKVEVNVNTVVHAYDWLQQQEIIYTRRGLGYFVSTGAKAHIHGVRHEEFMHEVLPELAKQMDALGIELAEVMTELEKLIRK